MASFPPGVTVRCLADTPTRVEYAALSTVYNACHPDHSRTADEMEQQDSRREARHLLVRFLAEREGEPVGIGATGHSPWMDDPRKFWVSINVLPPVRRQGIGGALYERLREVTASFEPLKLTTTIREDWTDAAGFVARRGFVEEMREWESRLDVAAFDFAPFADRRDEPTAHGIKIACITALQETTPDWDRRLYALEKETSEDVPRTDPFTFPDFEAFEKMTIQSPNFLPDAYTIAVDKATGEWVGSSGLWKRQADQWLDTGITGVKRSHRRQGIALAMKLKVIEYAKSVGCPVITTENATTNRGMLSINEALGFAKQPAWIVMGWQPHHSNQESIA